MTDNAFARIQQLLEDLDFPADKETVVAHAESNGGEPGSAAVKALRALPVGTYDNMSQIRSSVDLPPDQMPA